jgi:hypothetical protein
MSVDRSLPDFLKTYSQCAGWSNPADVFTDSDATLDKYAVLHDSHKYYMYLCMLVSGASNKAEPLLSIDPAVRTAMNQRGYFPVSICDSILRQYKTVEDSLRTTKSASFILANEYNAQRASIKPRAFTLSMRITRDKALHAYASFGYCNIQPMLGYEVLGCVAASLSMAMVLDTKLRSMTFLFHGMYNESVMPAPTVVFPLELPTYSTALEMLKLERMLRASPDVRPRGDRPLPALERKVINALQEDYRARLSDRCPTNSI